ncbi:glyoxalase [Chryseobacterium shigense]|uniref:Catechol 2,3-dioxygenase n=1 Tax=Chryseobacterium shigense TaxID=297244 RepID=A0A1N7HXL2_9FLAO|nr:VOC family protein [Chryseobacterium shigense]PQA94002.1 glyoxalase [Chryseobacterium shigense]SIS29587.1 Catechol 2,3-dioxygenase [Chryseobacterium shigense]
MNLVSIRIITANIERLVNFYEQVTGIQAIRYTPDFAELKTTTATLAIGSTRTLQFFGGDLIAQPAENRSAIIEFLVDDVDQEFERLQHLLSSSIIQEPTMMPWGNKSLLFRDPDGNLVNFFTPMTIESAEKFLPHQE